MFTVGDKQFNFAHIVKIEWIEEPIQHGDPQSGKVSDFYAFRVYMSSGDVEVILHRSAEDRHARWEDLIDQMESAGY